MKRFAVLMTIIGIVLHCIPIASANSSLLVLDNGKVYQGMDKPYEQGYTPAVSDGMAIVIVPLLYEGSDPIVNNKITAALDLGATDRSPFSYANYQKNVILADNPVHDGTGSSIVTGTVASYLVRFEIPLASTRRIGIYPVIIQIRFSTATESNISQSFTVYVNITDGIDPNAVTEPTKEATKSKPKIIVSKYTITPSIVTAGEPFEIAVTLLNTDDSQQTRNIVITYKGETTDILSDAKTNTLFLYRIGKKTSSDITLHMISRLDAEPRPQKVIIQITYEDSAGTSYSVTEEMIIPIKQPIRFECGEINLPETVSAGDNLPVSMQVFNKGKSTLFNVQCTLDMKGVIPDGASYLGNMTGGTSATAEIYAFFGTLDIKGKVDSNNKETEKYGLSTGTMTITYEDEYGKRYTETIELSTTIERPAINTAYSKTKESVKEPEKASQWWVSIVLLTGIGMILFGTISYRKKVDKLRREYGDEDI